MAEKKGRKKSARPAPQKAPRAEQNINVNRGEIIRWAVGFLAVFIILTFFPSINNGAFGGAIKRFLMGLFGPMYYVVPFMILIIDIFWTRDHSKGVAGVKYLLYALDFIFVSLLVHIVVCGENVVAYGELYSAGKANESAGLIGGAVANLCISAIGPAASTVLAILGVFICTVLLFGATPKDTAMAIIGYFREIGSKLRASDEGEDYEEEPSATIPERIEKAKKKESVRPIEPSEVETHPKAPPQKPITVELPSDPAELPDDPADIPRDTSAEEKDAFIIPDLTAAARSKYSPKSQPVSPAAPAQVKEDNEPPFDIPAPAEEEKPAHAANVGANGGTNVVADDEELFLKPVEETPYVFPPISLLAEDTGNTSRMTQADVDRTSRKLEEVLASFNVKAHVINTAFGPTVTRYELQPETGVRVKSISNLADDIALHLAANSVRIENIPGKAAIGIEIPNKTVSVVRLRGLIENPIFTSAKSRLFTALGEDVAGNPVYLDIAKMPHLLIAGATGMGKSVCINSLIVSLLYRNHPNDVKLILIDPKRVEFADYRDIPHLLVPVINEPKNAAGTLNWACSEMEKRYTLIQEVGARDLDGYNNAVADDPERELMPKIVIIIDELADLMMTAPDDVETSICRLAQKARAAGIHLVIGTQRPSVDVITGLIKANIPSRIACTVASQVDSRTILDMTGAEKLLGRGDMLYYPVGAMKPMRVQGAFVDGKSEVSAITQFIKEAASAQYDETIMQQIEQEAKLCGMKGKKGASAEADDDDDGRTDPMLMDAIDVAIECGTVSTSLLQRRLSLGYARAARIIDKMERKGYIGQFDAATKKRQILITREEFLELKLNGEGRKEQGGE